VTLRAGVAAVAAHTPGDVVENDWFVTQGLDTSDEWIRNASGIERRMFVRDRSVTTSDLGAEVLRKALAKAGWDALDLDAIVCATSTPEYAYPATAVLVQGKVGAHNAFGFDVLAACTGFVVALNNASLLVSSGQCRRVAVVCAELNSRVIDMTDRNTCVLFGDGAGAVLLEAREDGSGVIGSDLKSDGRLEHLLHCPPLTMQGKAVYRCAVTEMPAISRRVLEKHGLTTADVSLMVPHQANIRILQSTAENLAIPADKVMINVQQYGNTSSATIPIALAEALDQGRIRSGDLILTVAVGGGMVWGANLIRW
jgi:3-oxoacyl-[acyl-carrier-protein] synthase-3